MKTINNKITLIVIAIVLTAFTGYVSEISFGDRISETLQRYYAKYKGEKIYLQLDKPFYKPGESIWFKAYMLDDHKHESSSISQVAYVELINPKGNVEAKLSLPALRGVFHGDFKLDENVAGGMYKIRAYTKWMENFEQAHIYERDVQVQKVVLPRILMKMEFEKEAYGPGDKVAAVVNLRNMEDKPLKKIDFDYDLSIDGKKIKTLGAKTDKSGEAILEFHLPENLNTNDGLINVRITYQGNIESLSRSIPIVLNNISVRFMPEGGSLIKSIPTNIAFKAIDEFGEPADIDGVVYNSEHEEITRLTSVHDGMGFFKMTPKKDAYYVKLTRPAGIETRFNLPQVQKSGYVLNISDHTADSLTMTIASSKADEVMLIGQTRGNIAFQKTIESSPNGTQIKLCTKKFLSGVLQITLFDNYEIPRCERLVFIDSKQGLNIKISTDQDEYAPREEVMLSVETFDSDSMPVPANISLAVIDDKLISFADDKQDNILSYFLLSSELKGKIHEPSFYFNKNKDTKAELDLIMLTHGWRKFTWKAISNPDIQLKNVAEKVSNINGRVINIRNNKPVKAEVTLLEMNMDKRAAIVRTNDEGRFCFQQVNPHAQIKLLARARGIKPDNLKIVLSESFSNNSNPYRTNEYSTPLLPVIIKDKPIEFDKNEAGDFEANIDVVLEEDLTALDEVVVVGYGTQKKASLTGAIVEVKAEELANAPNNMEGALAGLLPGINVVNHAPGLGAAYDIRIRGASTIQNDEVLFIVDGVPVNTMPDSRESPLNMVSPGDIESVTVIKDPATLGVYGTRAANGVVLITTNRYKTQSGVYRTPAKTYTELNVARRTFSYVREFYAPDYSKSKRVEERNDFRTTVYWNPNIQTDENGKALVSFYNNDDVSVFRAVSEGIGPKGLIGRGEHTYFTKLPFSIDTKIPAYVCFGDTVELTILFRNNTHDEISGTTKFDIPDNFKVINSTPKDILVAAQSSYEARLKMYVSFKAGKYPVQISFNSNGLGDVLTREVEVSPKGFPVEISVSNNTLSENYQLNIADPLPGSIQAKFTAFPDISSTLLEGVESILREPYGCFEQTSSSTYPNIMVLQYLQESGLSNPRLYKKALGLIDKGYKRLISFETGTKGFEWFGRSPAHESLTAYGIMEFTDMQKVYKGVNPAMLKRTINWILSRRDAHGNFKLDPKSLDSFGRASREVTNAYIVYALSEAGCTKIKNEYEKAYAEAMTSMDIYRASLVAIASYNLGFDANGDKLLDAITTKISKTGIEHLTPDHSVTRSYGKSLQIETASLYMLALLKTDNIHLEELAKATEFIINSRSYGGFGSTQATIMALKALTEFTKYSKQTESGGSIHVQINNLDAFTTTYEKGQQGKIIRSGLENYLTSGNNLLQIDYTHTDNAVPYSIDLTYYSLTPNSSSDCKVNLKTSLGNTETAIGETVRLSVELRNKEKDGLPMTMAIIGIPSGLSLQPWQLKELQEKGVFDFYEVHKNYLVAYYRQMKPKEQKAFHLDLKAEVRGSYLAPASTAYLYYTNEDKVWNKGTEIVIR